MIESVTKICVIIFMVYPYLKKVHDSEIVREMFFLLSILLIVKLHCVIFKDLNTLSLLTFLGIRFKLIM